MKKSFFKCLLPFLAVSMIAGCGNETTESIDDADINISSGKSVNSESVSLEPSEAVSSSCDYTQTESQSMASPTEGTASQRSSSFLTPEEASASPAGTVFSAGQIDMSDPGKYFTASQISEGDAVYNRIYGKSWRENPDIDVSELSYLRTLIVNFDGNTEAGEMIVNSSIAGDVLSVFAQLYADGYQIRKMHLVEDYWTGDGATTDEASMEDDNTSAFNYRMTTSGRSLSNHALGYAIDVNPLENPYIYTSGDGSVSVSPANAMNIYDRSGAHVITESDEAYSLFTSRGFTWGGSWNNPKDYQHFEAVHSS